MNKLSDGGFIVVGIVLLFAGLVLRSDLVDWLVDVLGLLFLLSGAGVGIAGLVKLLTRKEATSVEY